MSKDVIIAGAIAAGCVALVAVALLAPKSKPEDAEGSKPADSAQTAPAVPGEGAPFGADPAAGGFAFGPATGAAAFPPAAAPGAGGFAPVGGAQPAGGGFGPPVAMGPTPVPAAPLPGAAPAQPAAGTVTHVVAAGETLGDIAQKYFKSSKQWKRIVDANPGLDARTLKVGQKLTIPAAKDAAPAAGAPADLGVPAAPGAGERTYTVKAKDSFYSIARQELGNGARWKEIQQANPGLDGNDLKVGKVIKLPAAAAPAAPASAPAAPGAAAPAAGKTHVVGKGETLADISRKYFHSPKRWKDIVAANPGLSPENLKIGQKLIIPDGAKAGDAAGAAAPAAAGEYVVKSGDTIRSIAAAQLGNGNDWKKIQDANPGLNPRALRPGQKIKVPGGKAAAPAAAAPAVEAAPQPARAASPFAGAPVPAGQPMGAAPAPVPDFAAGGAGQAPDFANPYGGAAPEPWGAAAPANGRR